MMGHDREGARKERSNYAGPGSDVKGGGTVGAIIWQRDLGGDREDAQGTARVSPLGGTTDHRDDREMWGRRRVGVSSSRGGDGIRGDLHIGVYIKRRKTTMKERVACWPIYELCMEAERIPRTIRMVRWWYQDAVNDPEE